MFTRESNKFESLLGFRVYISPCNVAISTEIAKDTFECLQSARISVDVQFSYSHKLYANISAEMLWQDFCGVEKYSESPDGTQY